MADFQNFWNVDTDGDSICEMKYHHTKCGKEGEGNCWEHAFVVFKSGNYFQLQHAWINIFSLQWWLLGNDEDFRKDKAKEHTTDVIHFQHEKIYYRIEFVAWRKKMGFGVWILGAQNFLDMLSENLESIASENYEYMARCRRVCNGKEAEL